MVLTIKELKGIAKHNKIQNYGKMKKSELQNILLEKGLIKEEDIKKIKPEKIKKEVVEIPESEKKIYCGINEPNKKQKRGTEQECIDKKQVKYYGLNKVDETKLPKKKTKDEIKSDKDKLKSDIKKNVLINKIQKEYNILKNKNEILKLNNDEKSIKELEENNKKIEKLKDEFNKIKS